MSETTPVLNFDDLPALDTCPIFMSIGTDLEKAIERFEQLSQRVSVCTKFAWFACADRQTLAVSESNEMPLREAFVRASLTEFAELESAAKRDLRSRGKKSSGIEARESHCPLIHSLRALRNVAIHVEPGGLSSTARNATVSIDGNLSEVEVQCWLLSRETVEHLKSKKYMKAYSSEQKERMFRWFDDAQRHWGVQELIRVGTRRYVEFFNERIGEYAT